jgi:hypothetical protein
MSQQRVAAEDGGEGRRRRGAGELGIEVVTDRGCIGANLVETRLQLRARLLERLGDRGGEVGVAAPGERLQRRGAHVGRVVELAPEDLLHAVELGPERALVRRQPFQRIRREVLARGPHALEEVVDAPQLVRGVDLRRGIRREALDERGGTRGDALGLPRQLERDRSEDLVAQRRGQRLRPQRFVGLVEELGVEKLREARVVAENLRVDSGRHLVDPSQKRLRAPNALSVGGEVGEVAGDALVTGDAHQRLADHLGHLRIDVGPGRHLEVLGVGLDRQQPAGDGPLRGAREDRRQRLGERPVVKDAAVREPRVVRLALLEELLRVGCLHNPSGLERGGECASRADDAGERLIHARDEVVLVVPERRIGLVIAALPELEVEDLAVLAHLDLLAELVDRHPLVRPQTGPRCEEVKHVDERPR